ncbi:MAG: TonB-dependent receptor plug domain-containing protein [Caldithrix sp.]|nr:TonB-dependent receptor plug domain-containing protein [Caldithrix sp.]
MKIQQLVCLLCLFPLFLSAEGKKNGGSLSGFVYDAENGEGLIGANVYLQDHAAGTSTNHNGYFVIPDLQPGEYKLMCQYIGYQSYTRMINITDRRDLRLNIMMQPRFLSSETITVEADSMDTADRLYRQSISQIALAPSDIRQMPQVAETDLLRSLQTLPGILPVSDYSSQLYVRGGTPDQNLYLIDGADVYNPEHFFGLFSTFNTDAIKNVEISKGGFGAAYGGRLSSILDVTNLDGNRNEFEGSAALSLLSAKTTIQMPIGQFGSISASIRRTYFDKTIAPYIDEVPDYHFYDGHIKAFFDINSKNNLTVSTYYSKDDLNYQFNQDNDDSESIAYRWGNQTLSLRWTHIFTPRMFSNFWVTGSYFFSDFNFELVEEKNNITDITVKGQFEYAVERNLQLAFGFENKNLQSGYDQFFPGGMVDVYKRRTHYIGYGSVNWQPTKPWQIKGGLRYNYFDSDETFSDWAPRFSTKYRLTKTISLKASLGAYHQYLHRIPRPFISDIWTTADRYHDDSRAYHYIIGVQKEVADNLELEIEAYHKEFRDIYSIKDYLLDIEPQRYDENGNPVYTETQGLFDRGDGKATGLELLLRKKHGSLTGWFSYALSRTSYTIEGINQNESFPPRHDRTSVANVVLTMDVRNAWRELFNVPYRTDGHQFYMGINMVYATGQPITLTSSTYYMSSLPDQNIEEMFLYPSTINSFRLPDYIRMDLSLRYKRLYPRWSWEVYLQIFNAGNRENIWFIQYENEQEENRVQQKVDTFNMFPLLPTLGININF